jgi:hypothetical protein
MQAMRERKRIITSYIQVTLSILVEFVACGTPSRYGCAL